MHGQLSHWAEVHDFVVLAVYVTEMSHHFRVLLPVLIMVQPHYIPLRVVSPYVFNVSSYSFGAILK